MPSTDHPDRFQQLTVQAAGRTWTLERPADLESLWQSLDEDDPEAEGIREAGFGERLAVIVRGGLPFGEVEAGGDGDGHGQKKLR